MHIDPARSRAVVTVARVAESLERMPPDARGVRAGVRTIPGIGVWTSAEVRQRSLGDPDAVSFGDYHVAKDVGWALTGSRSTTTGWRSSSSPGARSAAGCRSGRHGRARPSTRDQGWPRELTYLRR